MQTLKIKFRAWDREEKRWVYMTLYPNTISIPCPTYTKSSLLTHDEHPEAFSLPNLDGWHQLTGLKDKNGEEIYEGDIFDKYGKVAFKDGEFVACNYEQHSVDCDMDESGGYKRRHNGCVEKNGVRVSILAGTEEIIGNIYETPELLHG
jgi:uncharacterized phage protein (TIGR01671 family)